MGNRLYAPFIGPLRIGNKRKYTTQRIQQHNNINSEVVLRHAVVIRTGTIKSINKAIPNFYKASIVFLSTCS